jgi:hypothetical protein
MGSRPFFLDEAELHLDNVQGLSPRQQREAQQAKAARESAITAMIKDQLISTHKRLAGNLEQVQRIGRAGLENVEADREAHRRGELTDDEFAERLAEYADECGGLRSIVEHVQRTDEQTWAECSVTPAQYERAAQRRFPALFRGGRGLVVLPTTD